MNRRKFLGNVLAAGTLPVMVNGMSIQTLSNSPFLKALEGAGDCDGRVLVLVQLNGGNDGLNTVIPLDQYANLTKARPNIIIPENKIIPLKDHENLGLHPALGPLNNLYNEGRVTLVQNVGYPNQDFSHFRSTDIWLSGSAANETVGTGWLGRYLDSINPGFPEGYPNATNPDPLAIQVGAVVSPALNGPDGNTGIAINDPDSFYQLVTDTDPTNKETPMGHELAFLRQTALQTNAYAQRIKTAAGLANTLSTKYPVGNTLADQLKIVARLIAGGLQTKVYMVNLTGFDTHAAQVDSTDTTTGEHASLLKDLADAIFAFQDDLGLLGVNERVLGMTFSEFGRRIKSNGSNGTDHGAAAPLFLFGQEFLNKVVGKNPVIADTVSGNDNVPMENDFRTVYATILRDWFCLSDDKVTDVLLGNHGYLPINTGVEESYLTAPIKVYPNPTSELVNLELPKSNIQGISIELYNALGSKIQVIQVPAYQYNYVLNVKTLPNGMYYMRFKYNGFVHNSSFSKID